MPETDLWQRLKQRKLVQWALAYLAGAWVVLQGLDLLAQAFSWPDFVLRAGTIVLAVGLLAVLVLAWYHGERGAQRASTVELFMLTGILLIAGFAVALFAPDKRGVETLKDDAKAAAAAPLDAKSLAVLPFENLNAPADSEYLSDGLTEELINALQHVPGLKVASRTATARYKGKQIDPAEVGRTLRVANLLSGSVRKSVSRVRIVAELSAAETGATVWSKTYDSQPKDIIALQEEIARSIAEALEVELGTAQDTQLAKAGTSDLTAYTLYLQARFHMGKRFEPDMRRALQLYGEAVRTDPSFARAYAGLGQTWINLADDWVPPAEAYPAAQAALSKAVELDSSLADARGLLGSIEFYYEHDFVAAERHARAAVALDSMSETAHRTLGRSLAVLGKSAEAEAELRRGVALDPWSGASREHLCRLLLSQERYQEAIAEANEIIRVQPGELLGHRMLGDAYLALGNTSAALATYRRGLAADSSFIRLKSAEARALAASGQKEEARRIAQGLENDRARHYVRAEEIAAIYVALGEKDRALSWLNQALKEHSAGIAFLTSWPMWKPLRGDPRFEALLKQVGLP